MRNLFIRVLICLGLLSCDKGNLPPSAILNAFPPIGDTSILFEFNAGESIDDRSYPIGLEYRWDLDGDGTWDTGFNHNSTISYRYTKTGTFTISVEVMDLDGLTSIAEDTVEVFGENQDIDTLVDSRDGNEYGIVKIQGKWWMAENLRYGALIPTSQEQTDNDTIERYQFLEWENSDTVGGVYSWFEAMSYNTDDSKGICPDGWHIPTQLEWKNLYQSYPGSYAWLYYGKGGLSKLNLNVNHFGIRARDGLFIEAEAYGGFWSSSFIVSEREFFPCIVIFEMYNHDIYDGFSPDKSNLESYYLSIRCIKDT